MRYGRTVVERPLWVVAAWRAVLIAAAFPALHLGSVLQGGADAIPDSEVSSRTASAPA